MKRFGKYFLALLPTLVFSSVASASMLVVNCSVVSGPTELVSANISCGQFNLGGGFTLSNINITVSGGITGSITLTNGDTAPQSGSGTSTTSFNFGGLAGFSFSNPIYSPSFTTGPQALAAGQTKTFPGLSATGNGTLGNDTTIFAPYTGAGTFNVPVSTSTFFSSGGTGGSFSAAQSSSANSTAVVTYTYGPAAATPEPTTISLLGLGLIGFGFVARKFTATK
jgi:hypothetical protein